MQFQVRHRRSGYRAQLRDYRTADARIRRSIARAGRKARTFAAKRLRAASGYPATLIKTHFRYWQSRPESARLQWTGAPHAVDRLGWVGRRYKAKGRRDEVRVRRWPGTGGGKVFKPAWVTERGGLFSRYKSPGRPYRVVGRGMARLMREGGLIEPTRARFVAPVRDALAKWLSKRGGR